MKKNILKAITLSSILVLSISADTYAKFDGTFFSANDIVYYDGESSKKCLPSSGASTLSGSTEAEKIWNFLKSNGFTDEAAAGLMGNFYAESGYKSDVIQGGGAGPAAGLAQWENYNTKSGRWQQMADYAKSKGKDWTDLQSQLEYILLELKGEGGAEPTTSSILNSRYGGYESLKNSKDVQKAAEMFEASFERAGIKRMEVRYAAAEEAIATFGGKGNSVSSSSNSGNITFIGDSITAGIKDQLTSTFSGSNVDAVVGRGINQPGQGGGSIMDYLNGNPQISDNVVINIGTNDGFPESQAKAMLDKLKDKKVFLVNNFGQSSSVNHDNINSAISSVASQYSNVTVLDWKKEVEANGGREKFYASDGYHLNEAGQKLYLDFLKKSINNTSSSREDDCGESGLRGGDIVSRAIELAFPESEQNRAYNLEVSPKQKEALAKTGLDKYGENYVKIGASCDAFVSMVMGTTVDPEMPKHCCGVANLVAYMKSNPDKYQKIDYKGDTSNMKPGDIIAAGSGGGAGAHIEFYAQINGQDKVINGGWSRTTGVVEPMNLGIMEGLGPVEIFRWKG